MSSSTRRSNDFRKLSAEEFLDRYEPAARSAVA